MLNSAKHLQNIDEEEVFKERRKISDRRVSTDKIRFPFIDDNNKLVLKDRRIAERRASETILKKNPFKVLGKKFRK